MNKPLGHYICAYKSFTLEYSMLSFICRLISAWNTKRFEVIDIYINIAVKKSYEHHIFIVL